MIDVAADGSVDVAPEEPGGRSLRSIDVTDEQSDVPIDAERIRAVASRALDAAGVAPSSALGVTLVDRARIAELKQEHLGVHEATDVLSFPIDVPGEESFGPNVLGDLVVCPAVARRQARALGHSVAEEMDQLIVHGILHLLGHDHATTTTELAMVVEEQRLLAALADLPQADPALADLPDAVSPDAVPPHPDLPLASLPAADDRTQTDEVTA